VTVKAIVSEINPNSGEVKAAEAAEEGKVAFLLEANRLS